MASICNAVRQMLREHPELDATQTQIVHFNAYGASHLEFMVYCFTRTTEWVKYHAVKEDVLLRIMQIVQAHGAEFALPTQTLHIASTAPPAEGWPQELPDPLAPTAARR